MGGGVSAPKALYAPDPEYSEEARKAKYQGTVVLWLVVDASGRPQQIRVQRALGMGLDEKAIEAVKQWKFDPARKDGQAVPVMINVEVNFRLYYTAQLSAGVRRFPLSKAPSARIVIQSLRFGRSPSGHPRSIHSQTRTSHAST